MLIDDITLSLQAGRGGHGSKAFRRTAQTAKGGPDGGNGGNGGNIYIQASPDITLLEQFRYKKHIAAENGVDGARQNKYGRNGKDTILFVPLGTLVSDETTHKTYDLTDTQTKILIAKGGKGGEGNIAFKTATNQAPDYAEAGERGEEKTIHLTLRLIADVGLIGLPNAGKSSLLKTLTNAQPKIGNYAFTTLEPNLGMLETLTLADIPGLIEGAHDGKGLGIQFLKHVEKTVLLLHCIESTREDIVATYETIRTELQEYNPTLLGKEEIILITKSDLITQKDREKIMHKLLKTGKEILFVSLTDTTSIDTLRTRLLPTR